MGVKINDMIPKLNGLIAANQLKALSAGLKKSMIEEKLNTSSSSEGRSGLEIVDKAELGEPKPPGSADSWVPALEL
ncbi:unnamed protein product, partial [Iphiclides podalirius]